MKIKFSTPRWIHCVRAFIGGYFWLPCPLCGRNFGGHEKGNGFLMTSWAGGMSTCPKCREEARRRNAEWIKANPYPADDAGTTTFGPSISTSHAPVFSTWAAMPRALVAAQAEYAKKFAAGDTGNGPPALPVQETPRDAIQCTNDAGGLYWRAADGRTYWSPPKP